MSDPLDINLTGAKVRAKARNRQDLKPGVARRLREGSEYESLEPGVPVKLSFRQVWAQAQETNPELAEGASGEHLEKVAHYFPTGYVPLGQAPPLDVAITFYECNGHVHAVPAFAPQATALWSDGRVVDAADMPSGYNLNDALNGVYDGITANVLYFFQSFCFHPGAIPGPGPGYDVGGPHSSSAVREVVTLDTGRLAGPLSNLPSQVGKGLYLDDGELDQWPDDAVSGHGHAIADLIGRMTGEIDQSKLFSMRSIGGHTYQMEYSGGKKVRAFSKDMLLANLAAAADEYPNASVLNLSLGTANTPLAMQSDPVGKWLAEWISSGSDRAVVAAAGNHGTCVPNWPAAHAANWSSPSAKTIDAKHGNSLKHRDRIFSVGSAEFDGKTVSDSDLFSALDDRDDSWIHYQRTGREVEVTGPKKGDVAWTGTSFAAPQVAAELAMGSASSLQRKKP